MYSLRMLYVPEASVTVMLALGRSRMTVSFCPEVVPVPAAPGNRGVGKGPVAAGNTWPGPVTAKSRNRYG